MPRSVERDAHRLDVPEAAAAVADRRGDLLGDVEPIGREVDVVGDERHARADRPWRRRVGCGAAGPKSGAHPGVAIFAREPFEFAAPDVLEVLARRVGRRLLVEVDRHAEARRRPSAPTVFASATHSAIVTPSIGTNGTTSTAPSRGCSPLWRAQIDVGDRALEQRQHGALDAGGVAREREHRSVVRRVGGVVEQADARPRARIASAIAATTSGRRPSLTFGTHSISIQDVRF